MKLSSGLLPILATIALVSACKPKAPSAPKVEPAPRQEVAGPAAIILRTWTASDGRTMEGILLKRFEDAVVVRREADQREFTIPLANLSAEDHAYVKRTEMSVIKKVDAKALEKLINSLPKVIEGTGSNAYRPTYLTYHQNYQAQLKTIKAESLVRDVGMLRSRIESDLKKLRPVAGTVVKGGARDEVDDAVNICAWLEGPVTELANKLAALAP